MVASQVPPPPAKAMHEDRPWHFALAGALMLAGPIARDLYYARYPLGHPEASILIIGLGAAGAAIAMISWALGRYLGGVVLSGLLLVFLDLQFNFPSLARLGIVAALSLLVLLVLHRRRASIVALVLG